MMTEVAEFLQYITAEKGLSENTRSSYQQDLLQYEEFFRLSQQTLESVDHKHLRDYLARLRRREVGPRSLARKLSTLKQFFQFLLREGRIEASPAELLTVLVKTKRLPKHLTVDESFALLEAAEGDTPGSTRDRAMLEVWYATGCRVSELAGILAADIDWKGGLVLVRGKGGRERWVPLSQDSLTWAQRYRDLRHEWVARFDLLEQEVFFLTDRVKPYNRQQLWKWLRKYATKAGIHRKVWPHMIRHSVATHVLQGGADLRTVQELLGHRSISTTEIYTHLNVENLKTMQRKFHPRD
ncbi:tyrosine recombinase [bacterium]|nr:tyrosine recombinase [bacterium]